MIKKNINHYKLIELGFTDEEISKLLRDDILYKMDDVYTYQEIHIPLKYMYQKIREKNPIADKILSLCYYFEPDFYKITINVFSRDIKKRDFISSLTPLRSLLQTSDRFSLQDYNLYLFILSNIIDLPSDLKEKSHILKEENLSLLEDDTKIQRPEEEQLMRKMIFEGKFKPARTILGNLLRERATNGFKHYITSLLLARAIDKQNERAEQIKSLLKEERYEEALVILEREKSNHTLSNLDAHILLGILDILSLKYADKIPTKKPRAHKEENEHPFTAIENGDYKKAKTLLKGEARNDSVLSVVIDKTIEEIDTSINLSCEKMISPGLEEKDNLIEQFKSLLEKNISIQSITTILGISKARRNLCLLSLCDTFYSQNHIEIGDRILDFVEHHSFRSEEAQIINLLKDKRNNLANPVVFTIEDAPLTARHCL